MIPIQLLPISPSALIPGVNHAGNISGNAPQVPPALAALPAGSVVTGFVLNRDANGQPILRSEFGDFLIQSSVFLRIGSEVSIRVRSLGNQFRADIIEIDGQPASAEESGNARLSASGEDGQAARQRPAGPSWEGRQDTIRHSQALPELDSEGNVKNDYRLSAVLLSPSQQAMRIPGLQQGAALILRLFQIELPQTSQAAPAPAVGGNSPPANQAPAMAGNSPTYTSGGMPAGVAAPMNSSGQFSSAEAPLPENAASNIRAGSPLPSINNTTASGKAAEIYQQHQPLASQSAAAPALADAMGQTARAATNPMHLHLLSIIGHEQDGDAIAQTPFGLIKITTPTPLPTGSVLHAQMALNPQSPTLPTTLVRADGTASVLPASLLQLAQSWPALESALQILLDPAHAEDGLISIGALPQISLPMAGNQPMQTMQFSTGLFLFFAALQSGDVRNFLGEKAVAALQRAGKSELLGQLQADFNQLSRLSGETAATQWQSMFLPLLVNGQVEMLRWFTKRDGKKDAAGKKESESTRFIVEVNTSALGELQLDGLFRNVSEQPRRLELILRSKQPLDGEIQRDILTIVQDIQGSTGTPVSIHFQATPQFPERPLEAALRDIPDVVV